MPGAKRTMREYKKGALRSGSGKKVTSRKQAVAIAMSQEKKMKGKRPGTGMKSRGSRPVTMSGKSISTRKPGVQARKPNPKKSVGTTKSPGWRRGKGTM